MDKTTPYRSRGERFTRFLLRDVIPTTGMLLVMALAMAWVNS